MAGPDTTKDRGQMDSLMSHERESFRKSLQSSRPPRPDRVFPKLEGKKFPFNLQLWMEQNLRTLGWAGP